MTREEKDRRTALVTGGGHGIGRAIADAFAEAGADVVVLDRDGAAAAATVAALQARHPGDHVAFEVDVRDAAVIDRSVAGICSRFGSIEVLVNNAGIYPNTPVVEMAEEEWDAVFDVNVKGMFLVSRAVARTMIDRRVAGRIINISSGAAESGRIGAAHYCASKAAVGMFTRVLALELAPHGIAVNAVGPGLIEVPDANLSEEYVRELVASTPMGRIGQPEDVARAVVYLASPMATYITGTTLFVDGGGLAGRALPLSSQV
jgi:3-oxoacyl-[acyl-carrier protein] reductase